VRGGADDRAQRGARRDRNHFPAVVLHHDLVDVDQAGTVARVGLHLHLEAVSVQVEVVDVGRRQLALERGEDPVHRNVHRFGLRPVDVEEQLRRTCVERAEAVLNLRRLRFVVEDSEQPEEGTLQLFRRLVVDRLELERDAAGSSEAHDRRRLEHVDHRGRNRLTGSVDFAADCVDLEVGGLALAPVFQGHKADADVFSLAAHE